MRDLIRNDRGIAMTEAVIVIPFFILIWMGLNALHHLYAAKLEAQTISHGLAMSMAVAGECGTGETTIEDVDDEADVNTDLGDAETEKMLNTVAGGQPLAWSHAEASAEVTAEHVPEIFGGPTAKVQGRSKMMCNMKPRDGLVDMVVDMVMGWLGL